VAPPGLLRREAQKALDFFRDPERAGVVIVTLLEEMPVAESIELRAALVDELQFPVIRVVANRVVERLFESGERDLLSALPSRLGEDSHVASLARAGQRRALREGVQERSLAELAAALPEPRTELPDMRSPDLRRSEVEILAEAFVQRSR